MDFQLTFHYLIHRNKIFLGKAAENSGISIWEFVDDIKSRNLKLKYKISEAELEIEKILKNYKKN